MTAVRSTNRAKLAKYRAKRDFTQTGERSGEKARKTSGRSYLIQKHAAHVSIMTSVSNWVES
jgi:hypothetical protein